MCSLKLESNASVESNDNLRPLTPQHSTADHSTLDPKLSRPRDSVDHLEVIDYLPFVVASQMNLSDLDSLSDDEFFVTTEEFEPPYDELMDTDEDDEEEEEEGDSNGEYYIDEGEVDGQGNQEIQRIILRNSPNFLEQIQQVLQHGIGMRSRRTTDYEDPTSASRRRLQALPPLPYKAGKRLIYSGQFGEIDDRRAKKRRYEAPRTLTQYARFRELGWKKRESIVNISKKWIPDERMGRIVDQYDRHVYSGQFSHDGSFFYTASQDFKCRMYSTLNPSNLHDWKLYKVKLAQAGTVLMALRPYEEKLDVGQLQMRHYRTIIAFLHILQLLHMFILPERDQHHHSKLMQENHGKMVLDQMKIK